MKGLAKFILDYDLYIGECLVQSVGGSLLEGGSAYDAVCLSVRKNNGSTRSIIIEQKRRISQ